MADLSGEFRASLKKGKKLMHAGKHQQAEFWFARCREVGGYSNRPAQTALAIHRLAEVAVWQNDPMLARRRFTQALKEIDGDDAIGRAILLRDYGNFELLQGDKEAAEKRITQARHLLESDQHSKSQRLRIELIVTEGFEARTKLGSQIHDDAVETLRNVAAELYGYKKLEYELANLCWLISVLPLTSPERHRYLIRGMVLSARQHNAIRVGEFAASLGGTPLRNAYRSIVT